MSESENKQKPDSPDKRKGAKSYARKKRKDSGLDDPETLVPEISDYTIELDLLEKRTKSNVTDADGDIDFAYRNMALTKVTPLDAPSTAAWSWYIFARTEPNEFLKICHRREDAKAKIAGTITNQRMEDDKRQQFAVLDRLEKELTRDVEASVREMMEKFPADVLRVCRSYHEIWDGFVANDSAMKFQDRTQLSQLADEFERLAETASTPETKNAGLRVVASHFERWRDIIRDVIE